MRELSLNELAGLDREAAEIAIRSRVQTVYLGSNHVLTRVLGRPKMFLSTDDLGFAGHVMLDGYWEIWLTQFFARTVKPGMTVIDVGANFGYYTILLGDAVGSTGRVVAVEPVPSTVALLTKTVDLNGHSARTKIVQAALGEPAAGDGYILIPNNEPKNATVVAQESDATIRVALTNLDTLAADLDRVDLIKIDAEGAEQAIFSGMQSVIAQHKPAVMLEFNAARYCDAGGFLDSLRRRFKRIRALNFNGDLEKISDAQVLGTNVGEDWLLYLEVK